ncbi:MAG: type II toxin-antitoxin system VapC family toxin [Gaiellaceae bacterium]
MYADSSALVKLVVREPESTALASAMPSDTVVATSEVALVEIARAVRVSGLAADLEHELVDVLQGCVFVAVESQILRSAASLASERLRPLDAIHLATAVAIVPDVMYVYDRRLADAARELGLRVEAPGAQLA